MKKSIKILEALNDIDEKYLNGSFEDDRKVSEGICGSNKIKYVLTPVALVIVVIVGILLLSSPKQECINNEFAKVTNKDNNEDIVVFNEKSISKIEKADIDGKSVKKDLISEFSFLSDLDIPEQYSLVHEVEVYVKNDITDTEYNKLLQNNLIYTIEGSNINDYPSIVEISFTKEDQIYSCYVPDKNLVPASKINGVEVYLFSSESFESKQAIFNYNDYLFLIESTKLTENEFIDLIKSIIE